MICCMVAVMLLPVSCMKDLLDQQSTTQLDASAYWKNEDDALYALNGLYAAVRTCFQYDYFLDGQGEYLWVRGGVSPPAPASLESLSPAVYVGGGNFDEIYRYLYGGIHRANYVIDNVQKMITNETPDELRSQLETIIGESRFLRGLCYFRLISMWGDVPGIWQTVYDNSEVASIARSPMVEIKDSIYADFTYAYSKLPDKVADTNRGRIAKSAARAFRGKLQLYWACWNNFGWPELKGFTPSATEARTAYAAAAADFLDVIDNPDYGLTLFRNGEPGECDDLGKAEKLPNYYYLFLPVANFDSEFILAFTHGGTGTGQGERLMQDFAGRSHENSQVWVAPRYELADRYQSTITGDFCPPLVPMNPTTDPDYFTAENSALNPQSYANRDYRMKSTIQWDYEISMGLMSLNETGWVPYLYNTWGATITAGNVGDFPGFTAENIGQTTYLTDGTNTGYVYRKFVRNYAGQDRSNGDYCWPVMRLADVYLMYAEAINEVNNGPDAKAIELVNKVRHRGNLPPLAASKTATKDEFFKAIDQERIVELAAEGHRGFDLRRWRAIERVWCPPRDPNGVWTKDTWGVLRSRFFYDVQDRDYQRCYIFRIPESERNKNPNLTQNECWL